MVVHKKGEYPFLLNPGNDPGLDKDTIAS